MRQERTLALSNPDASLPTFLHQIRTNKFAQFSNRWLLVDYCGPSLIFYCTDSARTPLQLIDFIDLFVQSIIGATENLFSLFFKFLRFGPMS